MQLFQNGGLLPDIDIGNPINELSKSISDSISGLTDQNLNPMKTVFETDAGGVALVGENDSMLTKALTTFKSINIDKITSGVTNLIGGILNNPDLGYVLNYEDGFKVDTSELLRIASNGLGFNVGSMGDIKGLMGDEFLKELDSMTGGLSNGLFFSDGQGKLAIADGWQQSVGESLISFIGRNNEAFNGILNLAGVNSVLNVMIRKAAENAMYQSYDSFKGQYLFESDYYNALINSMEYCIARGDLESINKMLEIIGSEGLNKVRAQYPDLIERTLAGFHFTSNTYPEDYPELAIKLKLMLETVGGNEWYKISSEYGMIINLAVVSGISEEAKLLLSEVVEYQPLLCAAGIFTEQPAGRVFLSHFPKAVDFEN